MIDHDNRICIENASDTLGRPMGTYLKDGTQKRGKRCPRHHVIHQASKKGLTNTQWTNSFHPYLKYRKDYCENKDKRLGFKCTTNIYWEGMLDVDHIDGNHTNNDRSNLQTLCKCCHAYKSNLNEDWKKVVDKNSNRLYNA